MPRRAITEEVHAKLIDSYRDKPGDHAAAATAAGITKRTAEKLWSRGTRDKRPLRELVAEEQVLARARLQADALKRERELAPMLAAGDAAQTRAREAAMVRDLQVVVGGMARPVAAMLKTAGRLAQELSAENLTPGEKLQLISETSRMSKVLAETMHECLKVERTRLGHPDITIGVKNLDAVPLSLDEARLELEAAQRALQWATKEETNANGIAEPNAH